MAYQTFRAASTQAALAQVQETLGPDALIISVRQVPGGAAWQAWKRPEVEVLALPGGSGLLEIQGKQPALAKSPNPSGNAPYHPLVARSKDILQDHNTTKAEIASLLARLTTAAARRDTPKKQPASAPKNTAIDNEQEQTQAQQSPLPPSLVNVKSLLKRQGLDEALTTKVLRISQESLSPRALKIEMRVRGHIRQQLHAYIQAVKQPPVSREALGTRKIICLVGLSGSGKTSVCAKIARYASQELNKKVVWICSDTVRTGAIAVARAYTESLGIPLRLAYTVDELNQTVEAEREADLILVDNPARNPQREADMVELGGFLTALPERNTYLVTSATAKESDLYEIASALTPFNLQGLIVTKLDETTTYGSIYNLAWRSQLPLVYFSDSPSVLEALRPAHRHELINMVLE